MRLAVAAALILLVHDTLARPGASRHRAPQPPTPAGCSAALWPLPKSVSCGTTDLVLASDFAVSLAPSSRAAEDPALQSALGRCQHDAALRYEQRYRGKDIEPPQEARRRLRDAPVLHSLVVTVLTDEAGDAKQLEADESYSLRVGAAGGAANLTAPSLWGALYESRPEPEHAPSAPPLSEHLPEASTACL